MGYHLWKVLTITILLEELIMIYGCRIKDLTNQYNIIVDQDMKTNSVLSVKCITDTNELSNVKAKCLFGKWKVPSICNKHCPSIAGSEGLRVDYSSRPLSHGVTAKFQCTGQGLFLHGHDHATCLPSGHWSSPLPKCLDHIKLFFNKGHNATLACKSTSCSTWMWQFEGEWIFANKNNFPNLKNHRKTLEIINIDETLTGRYLCFCINLDSEYVTQMTYHVSLTSDKSHKRKDKKHHKPKHQHHQQHK